MIQLACSILALAGSWLAFNTVGTSADIAERGQIRRIFHLTMVGLAAAGLSASIMLLAWTLAGPVWSLS